MWSSPVSASSGPEQQFLDNLHLIERIVAALARRHALTAADAEEFGAWAKARMIEDDYAVFRKFGGRSSLATYLTTVLANLFRDFRNSRWGRWRPSAAAKRLGPTAIRLEELLYRDRLPLREAVQTLLPLSGAREGDLVRMAAQLPARQPHDEVSLTALGDTEARDLAAEARAAEPDDAADAVEGAVRALVEELSPEDGLILRMRFWSGSSVADISRALHLEQKALYRRIEAILARLRASLEARGMDRRLVADVLGERVSW